jgi:Trp operon repressor
MARDKLVKKQPQAQRAFQQELVGLFAHLKSAGQISRFLGDLLTPGEYNELALRWQIVKLLSKGLSIREVAYRLGVAIATVERGSRELKYSKNNGFNELLRKYA